MRQLYVATLFVGLACAPAAVLPAQSRGTPRVLKAIDAWVKDYRRGRLDLTDKADRGKKSVARKMKALPMGFVGTLTTRREIEVLAEAASKLDTAVAAERLLAVASVGLDDLRYKPKMAPHIVRSVGEGALSELQSQAAHDVVLQQASAKTTKATLHLQAAALRALGNFGPGNRAVLEAQLVSSEMRIRLAATEGLRRLNAPEAVGALTQLVEREPVDLVLEVAMVALHDILDTHKDTVEVAEIRAAATAAIGALGRTAWRTDQAIVMFLDRYRSRDAIPALIDVLQRFVDNPDDVKSGKLSGLLKHRAYDALRGMTAAIYPIDKPDEWRQFWEKVKDGFALPTEKELDEKMPKSPGTVAGSFFGIPVQGTRVVFLVDLSGSMAFIMKLPPGAEVPDRLPTRLDAAKRELLRAVEALPAEAMFNMVTFRGTERPKPPKTWDDDAQRWQQSLVLATDANKKKFRKHVEAMKASGGTNSWAGLQAALDLGKTVLGDRPPGTVDELFVLSDGMPSVGEVIDAIEILELIEETNRFAKVRINTVYIADELNARDVLAEEKAGLRGEEFMQLLAEQNKGRAVKL